MGKTFMIFPGRYLYTYEIHTRYGFLSQNCPNDFCRLDRSIQRTAVNGADKDPLSPTINRSRFLTLIAVFSVN